MDYQSIYENACKPNQKQSRNKKKIQINLIDDDEFIYPNVASNAWVEIDEQKVYLKDKSEVKCSMCENMTLPTSNLKITASITNHCIDNNS